MVPPERRSLPGERRTGPLRAWPGRDRFRRFLARAVALAVAPSRRNIAYWSICAATLGLELVMVAVLSDGHIYEWEKEVTRLFQQVPGRRTVFDVASFLTNTLSLPFVLLLLAVVGAAVAMGQYTPAFLLALTFPVHVLAQFPKAIIERPRPSAAYQGIDGVGGVMSFPSGHAEYVVSFYGLLACLALARFRSYRVRALIVALWLALAAATGFGRIATGRHWPIDILVSYAIGAGILSGLLWLRHALQTARAEILAES
ncbi:hypothetical protein DCC78_05245 [bacterium]|nr:phosphatase PAP2 family protein [Dehalococcoidia bacterium]RIL02851.1 MAG: hypothetical protein DCC78_05245 [bacterium]